MKKKFIFLLVFMFLIILGNVNAKEVNSDDIPNNSYVIGTYVFTQETTLSTKHIMLGATTIDSNDLSDMIIYYKTPWGDWWDGFTGEDIVVPDSLEVEYFNFTPHVATPELTASDILGFEDGLYEYSLWFNHEDYIWLDYDLGINVSDIKYFDIYEVTGDDYTLVERYNFNPNLGGALPVYVEAGTSRTFASKVCTVDSNNNEVCSNYSNEIVIDAPQES